jgi:hypothetical protein
VHQSRTLLDMLDLHDKGTAYVRGFFRAQWLEVWAVVAAMAWLAPRWLVTSPLLAVQLALAGGLFAGLQSGGDWMDGHRLLTTLYPLLAVAAAAGIRELRARLGGSVAAVALAGIGSALVMTTPMLTERTVGRLGMRLEVQLRSLEPFTRWADALHLERPVVVAMGAMGGASLTTTPDFRLIDVFGLTTREVARRLYTLESTGPEPLWAWLFDEQRPHFLEYPETIRRRWDLDQCTRCRAAYLLIETRENDPEARVGTFVRRDLVSDEPPADLAWTGCEDGPAAAVEVRDGRATLWWRGPFTRAPTGQLRWIGAEGATLATGPVKAFDGAFSWLLYAQRAVIREQRAAPAGALDATFTRVSGTDDCRAAQAALDGLPLVAGGDFEPGGEQWSAVPPGDLAFGAGFEGRAVAVSQVGRASWACGPYSPVTGPQRVSVRVRGEGLVNAERGVATAGVAVRARRASGKWRTVMLSKVDGSFDWMRVSATWKPREDDRKWAVCVGGGAASGTLYADEVRAGQAP